MLDPLYPKDGDAYLNAMREAQAEYDEWNASKADVAGITIFSRKELDDDVDSGDFEE